METDIPTQPTPEPPDATKFVLNRDNGIEERPGAIGLETGEWLEVVKGVTQNDPAVIGNRSLVKTWENVEPKLAAPAQSS